MRTLTNVLGVVWRAVIVGLGYALSLMAVGLIFSLLGTPIGGNADRRSSLAWLFVSGFLMAVFLGPLAARMRASRRRHIAVWASVIFFNMGSVAIEGAIFAPELVPIPLPVLFLQQLLASVAAGVLITVFYSTFGEAPSLVDSLRLRAWYSWVWRFVLGSLSYIVFYFVFGAINFALVTQPYYASHAGGLTVPPPSLVMTVEVVRSPLIILSAVLFMLTYRAEKRRSALVTGLILFWIGGVVPLALQLNALPLPLLAASGLEIFFQNFLAGVVAAALFWTTAMRPSVQAEAT